MASTPDTTIRRIVVGFTTVAFVYTVGYVVRFGSNMPVYDEWDLVRAVLPGEWSAGWLIAFHNEHRYPVAKLLWSACLKATGYDFRGPMLLTTVLLAGTSLALTQLSATARGRPRLADVALPAVLLGWAHQFNLLMGYQVAFAMIPVCMAGLLAQVVRYTPGGEAHRGLLGGMWLALLAANGGFGFGYVPAVAMWVAYLGWRAAHGGRWVMGGLVLVFPALTVAYVAQTMGTMPASYPSMVERTPLSVARATAEYLTCGLGLWVTAIGWEWVAAGVESAFAVAVGMAVRAARDPAERPRALGVLLLLAGHVCVGLGVAWARGAGLSERYVTPSAAGFLPVWFAFVLYGPRMPRVVAGLVVAAAVGLLVVNHRPGYRFGIAQRNFLRNLQADVRSGMPPIFVAGKYGNQFMTPPHLGRTIDELRQIGHAAFRDAVPDPPMIAQPVAGAPTHMPAVDDKPFRPGGPPPPSLRIPDPPLGRVLGLRLLVTTNAFVPWAEVVLRWTDADGHARSARSHPPFYPARHHAVLFWVDGPASGVQLEPACPTFGYPITAVEWLVPSR